MLVVVRSPHCTDGEVIKSLPVPVPEACPNLTTHQTLVCVMLHNANNSRIAFKMRISTEVRYDAVNSSNCSPAGVLNRSISLRISPSRKKIKNTLTPNQ